MDYCTPTPERRHNPVDSICRKLETIRWRGDREPNSPFQIPKLASSSYNSYQCELRHNLGAILKKTNNAAHTDEVAAGGGGGGARDKGRGGRGGAATPTADPRNSLGPSLPPATPFTPATNPLAKANNVTFTITSTLGERRGGAGSGIPMPGQSRAWQRCHSTPGGPQQTIDSPSSYSAFSRIGQGRSPPVSRAAHPKDHGSSIQSYNLNFCSGESGSRSTLDCELPYPALVVKRLSMGEGASMSETSKDTMAEVSLICEEDLLNTMFHACDTQRRGKVYVSHIVDYLRNTTCRSSEDSGLEDLCNMLDPDHKDVSIDLDTYHAIMKEWIDDCRNNGEESTDDLPQDSAKFIDGISAKRSMLLNMTSGSLEGFGGDASRVDFETSDLMYCVADLQMNNTRLQDEVKRLKLVVESTEETNQKLAEENEELHHQARMSQQVAQKEKMLKDEVEEMKLTLSSTEEGRARASQHCKNMEKENHSLIANITSLQEENFKVTMEMDELQRRLVEMCDHNTELQVQIHSSDALMSEKDTIIQEMNGQIKELKAGLEEYYSVTELLRANKNKLENQIQMMHPDMSGARLTLSAAFSVNQTSSGSLQTELTLAQLPQEGVEPVPSMLCYPSTLDETLDREVLMLLQGPNPEHMALEFRGLLNKLKWEFREEVVRLLSTVRSLVEDPRLPETRTDDNLQTVQAELDARRADWALGLDQLAQYTDSLEKELIKMAGNMRRSRTDILHLSVRVQEQENQKRQLSDELEELKSPQDSREASCQTPDLQQQPEEDLDWDEEFALQDFLKRDLEERNCSSRADDGRTGNNIPVETATQTQTLNEGPEGGDSGTSVDTGGERGARETFTPPFIHSDSAACPDPEVNCEPEQEEAEVLLNAHSQSVSQETDALLKPTHSNCNDVKGLAAADSVSGGSLQNQSNTSEQDQAVTADWGTPPRPTEVVRSSSTSSESPPRPTGETCGGAGEGDGDPSSTTTRDMSLAKSLSQNQSADKAVLEDSTSLLPPVLEEEEEGMQDQAQAPSTEVTMAGTDTLATLPDGGSPDSATVLGSSEAGVTLSDPGQADDGRGLSLRGKFKRELELSRSMEAIEEHRVQEDPSEVSVASEKEVETSVISDAGSDRDDKNGLSVNDKEIETEFQRLSLGFKCDMFTLEKRLRLEERSRDLAEENVRKEVSSCQGLLQALTPLCEDDNQSMEIIQRLQKNLDILIQSMTRVSSRSEMLGAIHQESRIGKAVEVMITHVDNLRRMYTKEHAELLELRETLMQSERSFGSHSQDDFRGKKQSPSQYYKSSSTRRVTIAAIPRSPGSSMHFDMGKTQDTTDDGERRRSPWKSTVRPPLKRFVSSGAWVDTEEPSLMMRGRLPHGDSQSEDERKEEPVVVVPKRRSSLSELGSKLTSLILPLKTGQDELFVTLPSPTPSLTVTDSATAPFLSQGGLSTSSSRAAVARSGRGLWLWLALVVVLAGLLALLASLVMQPAADASPVGTGDSWMTIQQLLWPYTGLRHNGQPPI